MDREPDRADSKRSHARRRQAIGDQTESELQRLLVELDKSPGLAQMLADAGGMEFPHIGMDKGRARLLTENDMAAMTLRVHFPLPRQKLEPANPMNP